MTVNLRPKLVKIHSSRRLKKSIDYMREHIARHTKSDPEAVKLSSELNRYMLLNVSRRMVRVKVNYEKAGGNVKVDLADELKKKAPAKAEEPKGKTEKKEEMQKKDNVPKPAKEPEGAAKK